MELIAHFSSYIKSIAMYLIFMALVGVAAPKARYKDYINLTMGFILIFIVLGPIQGILGEITEPFTDTITGLENKLDTSVTAKEYARYDEMGKTLLVEEFKSRIKDQLAQKIDSESDFSLEAADISVDTDSESFGNITELRLSLTEAEAEPETEKKSAFIRVEPVEVESVSVFASREDNNHEQSDERSEDLKKSISSFYNVPVDNIHITVQKNQAR